MSERKRNYPDKSRKRKARLEEGEGEADSDVAFEGMGLKLPFVGLFQDTTSDGFDLDLVFVETDVEGFSARTDIKGQAYNATSGFGFPLVAVVAVSDGFLVLFEVGKDGLLSVSLCLVGKRRLVILFGDGRELDHIGVFVGLLKLLLVFGDLVTAINCGDRSRSTAQQDKDQNQTKGKQRILSVFLSGVFVFLFRSHESLQFQRSNIKLA